MLVVSLVVIACAVLAVMWRAEVRLTLLLAALTLGTLAGKPEVIVDAFFDALVSEQFLVPIGCCMGFAFVLRHTGCDRQLVLLLTRPLRRVRPLLVPGLVLVGVLVNAVIISQASAGVAVGAVLVPVLRGAGFSPVTVGAALLLGVSVGGELLNPGAPEFRTVVEVRDKAGATVAPFDLVRHVAPLLCVHLAVSVPLFCFLCRKDEATATDVAEADEPISVPRALVPLVPLVLLFLTALPPPLRLLDVPTTWLSDDPKLHTGRLIGAAMVVGTAVAALIAPGKARDAGKVFFEGAGHALATVTSVIAAATCFGKGVELAGVGGLLKGMIATTPGLLFPLAAVLPMGFAWVCGSGMASTQSVYGFFDGPAEFHGVDPLGIGALVSLTAASGRTMSPVAAVVLLSSSLSGASPLELVRRVALPLLAGSAAAGVAAWLMR